MDSVTIKSRLFDRFTEEEFLHFTEEQWHVLKIERSANGEIIFMSPSFPHVRKSIAKIIIRIGNWAMDDGSGEVLDSSAGFTLPNMAVRGPDISWISKDRWNKAMQEEANKKRFPHVVPEFVWRCRLILIQ